MRILRSLRNLLPLFITFFIILEAAAFVITTPRPRDSFLELYVLDSNRSTTDYYPSNSSLIRTRELVKWYVEVSNQMGAFQFVDIQVKLGNQGNHSPDATTGSASNAPLIVEFKRFMSKNETWEIPFVWQVLNFTSQNSYSRILQLQIDNITYTLQSSPTCSTPNSCSFRFIFELWTWNVASGDFQIGWQNADQRQIAWIQLWFNLTPGPP